MCDPCRLASIVEAAWGNYPGTFFSSQSYCNLLKMYMGT